jgi:hypothetical protein
LTDSDLISFSELTVLGIDLASKSWSDNGSAILSFTAGTEPVWTACRIEAILWPDMPLSPETLAKEIDQFMLTTRCHAVSIDGPQGWKDPLATQRPQNRRLCESEAQTPGKTRVMGVVVPHTYTPWVTFCIAVFDALLDRPHVILVNDSERVRLDLPPVGSYYLLECFPTLTWRTSGLKLLPGHSNASPDIVESFALMLRERFGLPMTAITRGHDHLQAVVAALPAAALLGGPCDAVPRGEPGHEEPGSANTPAHRVEGLIWDAVPRGSANSALVGKTKYIVPIGYVPKRRSAPAKQHIPRVLRECLCGCRGIPKRGRFLQGHDMKLKSALIHRIKHGDESARDELRQLGWERFAPTRE